MAFFFPYFLYKVHLLSTFNNQPSYFYPIFLDILMESFTLFFTVVPISGKYSTWESMKYNLKLIKHFNFWKLSTIIETSFFQSGLSTFPRNCSTTFLKLSHALFSVLVILVTKTSSFNGFRIRNPSYISSFNLISDWGNYKTLYTRNSIPLYFEVNVWGLFVITLIWLENWFRRLKIHENPMLAYKLLFKQFFFEVMLRTF